MPADTVAASNKSKCLPQMKANHYLKLFSPILFLIAFFAVIQVLLLTTAETSSSGIVLANLSTATTATNTTTTTPLPPSKWFEIWKNGYSFLHSPPEILSPRSRRSQKTTTLSPSLQRLKPSSAHEITDARGQNVTESKIKAPELHVASESEKILQVSNPSIDEPQTESTGDILAKQDQDDGNSLDTPESASSYPQKESTKNEAVYNKFDGGYSSNEIKLPLGMDISELVPGSFEGLVGADEDLSTANDNDSGGQESQANQSTGGQQQPEASELVLGSHSNHIGPSLETIIHDDKAGDIRAQVGLSLHYQPSHSLVSDAEEPDDSTSSLATGGSAEGHNDGEATSGSNNEQQEDYRAAKRRYKAADQDIGRVIVSAKGHKSLSRPSKPKKQVTTDLNTAAGHYYGKKKKKMMIYKKKKIKKKKKKKIIIVKKKKKKYMKKKKVKKYKKKKIVIIKKKKKRKAKKYHNHGHHYGHHGGYHGGGHGHGKYYMYAKVPKKKSWEFGFKRGNKKHWIERHEKGHKNKFKTKVKWYDAKSKGKGIHVWDYNHHDKKKKKHYG